MSGEKPNSSEPAVPQPADAAAPAQAPEGASTSSDSSIPPSGAEIGALQSATATQSSAAPDGSKQIELPEFAAAPASAEKGIDLLNDVELDVKIELGRAVMLIEDVLKLGEGSVVELEKLAGDPVDVFVNDRLVARGEVLVLNDNFCVRVSEIVAGQEAAEA